VTISISITFFQTPPDLSLYSSIDGRKLKNVDAKYQGKVGYLASSNYLQDYKIYGTKIKITTTKCGCSSFVLVH
jgi:hypothetical protein